MFEFFFHAVGAPAHTPPHARSSDAETNRVCQQICKYCAEEGGVPPEHTHPLCVFCASLAIALEPNKLSILT
jgi:hypothetical protein